MPLLSRSEYNLILRSFDYYEFKMNTKERQLREQIEEKLYNNCYNPKDKVAQTNVNLEALYDIQTEKDLSEDNKNEQELSYVDSLLTTGIDDIWKGNKITQDMVNASLNTPMWYEKNND